MFARKDYMNGVVSHHDYYMQFVTPELTARVVNFIGAKNILASSDQHMNDIPLHRWDTLSRFIIISAKKIKEAEEITTLCTLVCIAKAAAKEWKRTFSEV